MSSLLLILLHGWSMHHRQLYLAFVQPTWLKSQNHPPQYNVLSFTIPFTISPTLIPDAHSVPGLLAVSKDYIHPFQNSFKLLGKFAQPFWLLLGWVRGRAYFNIYRSGCQRKLLPHDRHCEVVGMFVQRTLRGCWRFWERKELLFIIKYRQLVVINPNPLGIFTRI